MPDNVVSISRAISRSRRKRQVRARSLSTARLTLRARREYALSVSEEDYAAADALRPTTRGDCASLPRPCPFVSCAHNLYLDVSERTGAIKTNFPDLAPDEMPEDASCALDVADGGSHTLEQVGAYLNFSRERERQIEVKAFAKLKLAAGARLGELADAAFDAGREVATAHDHLGDGGGGADDSSTRAKDEEGAYRRWIYRIYDRELRERGFAKTVARDDEEEAEKRPIGDESGSEDEAPVEHEWHKAWTADELEEIEGWSSNVLFGLRRGEPLRSALVAPERFESARIAAEADRTRELSAGRAPLVELPPPPIRRFLPIVEQPARGHPEPRRLSSFQPDVAATASPHLPAEQVVAASGRDLETKPSVTKAEEVMARGTRQEQVFEWLKANGPSMPSAIAASLGTTDGNVASALAQLRMKRRVERTDAGWNVRVGASDEGEAPATSPAKPNVAARKAAKAIASPVVRPRPVAKKIAPTSDDPLVAELRARRDQWAAKVAKLDELIEALA